MPDEQRALFRYLAKLSLFLGLLVVPAVITILVVDPKNSDRLLDPRLKSKIETLARQDQDYHFLILGDSRAEMQIDPGIIAKRLNVENATVLNVAVKAGDLSSAVQALKAYPQLTRCQPLLVISVSFFSINDGATETGFYGDDLIAACSPFERLQLVGPSRLTTYYLRSLTRLVNVLQSPKISSDEFVGFRPVDRTLDPHFTMHLDASFFRDRHPWYRAVQLRGIRHRVARRQLAWLATCGCDVVIYEGPNAPSWNQYVKGSRVEVADYEFTSLMQAACSEYGVTFLSFRDEEGFEDRMFADSQHVNRAGAHVFSERVADELTRRFH